MFEESGRKPDSRRKETSGPAEVLPMTKAFLGEAYDRVSSELRECSGLERDEVGVTNSKQQLGGREVYLRRLLECKVISPPTEPTTAQLGVGIEAAVAYDDGEKERWRCLIGSEVDSIFDSEGIVISACSPLGGAILGRKQGDTVRVDLSQGRWLVIEIEKLIPYDQFFQSEESSA